MRVSMVWLMVWNWSFIVDHVLGSPSVARMVHPILVNRVRSGSFPTPYPIPFLLVFSIPADASVSQIVAISQHLRCMWSPRLSFCFHVWYQSVWKSLATVNLVANKGFPWVLKKVQPLLLAAGCERVRFSPPNWVGASYGFIMPLRVS